jgi:hypothetical protein
MAMDEIITNQDEVVSQQQTAFRLKEKKYQLFKEQTVRYRY